VVEALLGSEKNKKSDFPGETSTIFRLISWFFLLRTYFEGVIHSMKLRWADYREIQKELNALLPLSPESLETGWLRKLVRYTVNSGLWLQTHFA